MLRILLLSVVVDLSTGLVTDTNVGVHRGQ